MLRVLASVEIPPSLSDSETWRVWIDASRRSDLDRVHYLRGAKALEVATTCRSHLSANGRPDSSRGTRDDLSCDEAADDRLEGGGGIEDDDITAVDRRPLRA